MRFRIFKFRPAPLAELERVEAGADQTSDARGHAGQRVLLRRREERGASDPALRVLRDAPPPAAARVPEVQRLSTGAPWRRVAEGPSSASSSSTTRRCRDSNTRCPVVLVELEEGTRIVIEHVGHRARRDRDRYAGRSGLRVPTRTT